MILLIRSGGLIVDSESIERELRILKERDHEIGLSGTRSRDGSVDSSESENSPYVYPDFEPYVGFSADFVLAKKSLKGFFISFFFQCRNIPRRVRKSIRRLFQLVKKFVFTKNRLRKIRSRLFSKQVATKYE